MCCFIVVFSFWTINFISLELEMPFGDDANDLPLEDMQRDLNRSLSALMLPQFCTPPSFIVTTGSTHLETSVAGFDEYIDELLDRHMDPDDRKKRDEELKMQIENLVCGRKLVKQGKIKVVDSTPGANRGVSSKRGSGSGSMRQSCSTMNTSIHVNTSIQMNNSLLPTVSVSQCQPQIVPVLAQEVGTEQSGPSSNLASLPVGQVEVQPAVVPSPQPFLVSLSSVASPPTAEIETLPFGTEGRAIVNVLRMHTHL